MSYLQQALKLAECGQGFCAPNPAVGAVIVKDDRIIAKGFHTGAGTDHAEIVAFKKINFAAKDATLYVTLEPCCHQGKTPPCTEAIIKSGINQVYYGFEDPNPQVSGKGIQQLINAGIPCQKIDSEEINNFYQSYQFWWQNKRPFVTGKLALSLDGKIAGPGGKRINITDKKLQEYTHQWRKKSDAILTTAKTIAHDDPQLNVRLAEGNYRKPLYILDTHLSLSPTAKVFSTTERIIVFHSEKAEQSCKERLQKTGASCIEVSQSETGLCLEEIVSEIGKQGIHDLWLEAGGRCFQAFAEAKLLQRGLIYVAPKWLGKQAQAAFTDSEKIFVNVKSLSWHTIGKDAFCKLIW